MSSKPRFWALAGLGWLSACGFTPLYGDNQAQLPVASRLEQVKIANIPERTGQLLKESLETQMQLDGAPDQQLYVLNVTYGIERQGIGVQEDTAVTRNRFVATALWHLAPIGTPNVPLASGQASTEDAQNVIDQQYFGLTLEDNTINKQLADEIAAEITSQVAAYFKTHPTPG